MSTYCITATPGLVSVVVPAFNVSLYIDATLASLCTQTYRSLEVLVVDDGSSDDTAFRVARIAASDPRVRLLRHSSNQGLPAARNTGIAAASGEFVSFIDSDDIAHESWIEAQVSALMADSSLGMCGTQFEALDEEGGATGVIWKRPIDPAVAGIGLLFRNTFSVGMTVRRSAIPKGGFADMPMAEDYDFNVRVAENLRVLNLPEVLVGIRVRQGGLTGTKKPQMETCVRSVILKQLNALGLHPSPEQMDLHRQIGSPRYRYSNKQLMEVESWLRLLIEANARVERYEQSEFKHVIAQEWFNVCALAAPLGRTAWDTYWASNLTSGWRLSLSNRLMFALKCVVRHDRMRRG
jgi:glycosyltransferase involved in cell wall biosynthesis